MQRTLVLLKPDAVQRRLVGRIVSRFEDKGIKLAGMKMVRVSRALAKRLYAVHKGKDFYDGLLSFITSGPVIAMVLEGVDVIAVVRKIMGPTFGPDAPAGTIRGDLGMSRRFNLVHGSDCAESAAAEIPLFFAKSEQIQYQQADVDWVYAQRLGQLL